MTERDVTKGLLVVFFSFQTIVLVTVCALLNCFSSLRTFVAYESRKSEFFFLRAPSGLQLR